jgi:hypothetical protein
MTPKAARILLACEPTNPAAPDPARDKAIKVLQTSPELSADYQSQIQIDAGVVETLRQIAVPPATSESLRDLGQIAASARTRPRFNLLDPATLSVTIGILLLAGILIWQVMGRAGVFPEEALTIAAAGTKLGSDQFEVVDEQAGRLEDWFLMKGFEKYRVPPVFSSKNAAGVRIFKVDGQPVAVLAIPENFMFFMVFDPDPLGIHVEPAGSWRFAEFDVKYAAALCEIDGVCFMVVIQGTKEELEDLVAQKPRG